MSNSQSEPFTITVITSENNILGRYFEIKNILDEHFSQKQYDIHFDGSNLRPSSILHDIGVKMLINFASEEDAIFGRLLLF